MTTNYEDAITEAVARHKEGASLLARLQWHLSRYDDDDLEVNVTAPGVLTVCARMGYVFGNGDDANDDHGFTVDLGNTVSITEAILKLELGYNECADPAGCLVCDYSGEDEDGNAQGPEAFRRGERAKIARGVIADLYRTPKRELAELAGINIRSEDGQSNGLIFLAGVLQGFDQCIEDAIATLDLGDIALSAPGYAGLFFTPEWDADVFSILVDLYAYGNELPPEYDGGLDVVEIARWLTNESAYKFWEYLTKRLAIALGEPYPA